MALDPSKPLQQAKIPAGTVLFEHGQKATMLCLVHSGEITARTADAASPKRLYSLGPNSTPGFAPLLLETEYSSTLFAAKESVISAFPVKGNFTALILGKLNVGIMAARSLMTEITAARDTFQKLNHINTITQRAVDNLSIAYFRANPEAFKNLQPGSDGGILDPVMAHAKATVDEFMQSGGEMPEMFTDPWLKADYSGLLKKDYNFESKFDEQEFNFLRRLLALPVELQGQVFKTDIQILQGICQTYARILDLSTNETMDLQGALDTNLSSILTGDYSFVEKYYLLSDLLNSGITTISMPEFLCIAKFLHQMANGVLGNYERVNGTKYQNLPASLDKLQQFLNQHEAEAPKAEAVASVTTAGVDVKALRSSLAGSAMKIMTYCSIPTEEARKTLELLKQLRGMQLPLDSGGEPRKIRRAISKTYWQAYEAAYHKYRENRGDIPETVQWMLNYGYFDDECLDDEHIAVLSTLRDLTKPRLDYPIINSLTWLSYIGEKKEPPSVDELGQTFFEKLKTEHKDKGWKKETDVPEDFDNANIRTHYEIHNFLESSVRITSGSPPSSFPILTRYQITVPLEKSFVTYKRISEIIDQILSVDISAFHREVIINDEAAGILKEFVQQQVLPYFIIIPSIGTKVMMWQELALARLKSSRGRISVPVFATADLYTLVLEAVGAFRWELTKTIMGPDWNNVSQPSITADYVDYVQFFKKNRELSPEIKEKLAMEFKRFRSDRDRFVNDYTIWVKFESEGSLKLNRVARSIFYRHIPFAKSTRDKLAVQPAFTDLHNRFTNIRNRKLKELEVKYRKYGETLPEILKKNLEFHSI